MKRYIVEIDYINGPRASEVSGRAKYQNEIHRRLDGISLNPIEYTPHDLPVVGGIFDSYFKYPFQIWRKAKKSNIRHFTSQELAYLLIIMKSPKTIVTCYDFAHEEYQDGDPLDYYKHSFRWRLNLNGIRSANRIITISEFSKAEIIKYIGYPEDKIHIAYPAIDHDLFYPRYDRDILRNRGIADNEQVVLYVGSEQPRQNVSFLIRAFAELKRALPDVKLVKVGNPQSATGRAKLLELIRELGLEGEIIFVGYAAEQDLPRWYSAADLFVYPCLYTSFSMPSIEAMACGVPIVTSNIAVLQEVVGNGGTTVDPHDISGLANKMHEILTNDALRKNLIQKGLERAKMFTWEQAAKETLKVYSELQ